MEGSEESRRSCSSVESVTFMKTKLNVLQKLADRFGANTEMDYVSDRWGSEPCVMTPAEAIAMHRELGWTDDDYAVRMLATDPGDAALVEQGTGNAILVVRA